MLLQLRTTLNVDDELLRRAHLLTGVRETDARFCDRCGKPMA